MTHLTTKNRSSPTKADVPQCRIGSTTMVSSIKQLTSSNYECRRCNNLLSSLLSTEERMVTPIPNRRSCQKHFWNIHLLIYENIRVQFRNVLNLITRRWFHSLLVLFNTQIFSRIKQSWWITIARAHIICLRRYTRIVDALANAFENENRSKFIILYITYHLLFLVRVGKAAAWEARQ